MIRAYIRDTLAGLRVDVFIIRSSDGDAPRYVLHFLDDHASSWDEIDEGAYVTEPTFRIPHDVAHSLLKALSDHLGGVDDLRTLRADYDAERGRVDTLTSGILELARSMGRERYVWGQTGEAGFNSGLLLLNFTERAFVDSWTHHVWKLTEESEPSGQISMSTEDARRCVTEVRHALGLTALHR